MYEYRCHQCGKVFEKIQKFADEPLTTHEGCGGAVERLMSAPALQFKGSGWYITDYARAGSSKAAANGETGGKTETKSDTSKSSDAGSSTSSSSSPASSSSSDSKK
jgi:putative FmdB family regulatory protein